MEYREARPYVSGWSLELIAGIIGIVIVVAAGKLLAARKGEALVDIAQSKADGPGH
jgi:hypothetical protein